MAKTRTCDNESCLHPRIEEPSWTDPVNNTQMATHAALDRLYNSLSIPEKARLQQVLHLSPVHPRFGRRLSGDNGVVLNQRA